MTRTELLDGIQPILRAYSYEAVNTTDSEMLPSSIEIRSKSICFGGLFLEAIGSYCRANFQPWVIITDGSHPVVSLKYTE